VNTDLVEVMRVTPMFGKLSASDRGRLAAVSRVRSFARGEDVAREGDPSEAFYVVVRGRVKVFKTTPAGKDLILEIFGPGDLLGAVAVYEARPYPASIVALEDTTCVVVPRPAFFALLEQHPTLVRGLLLGLTQRLVELTNRLALLTGTRVEARFARLFLKLGAEMGQARPDGVFIPISLSRQELADLTGTTIETCIRIMSRWGKQEIVRTEKDGFLIADHHELETLAQS
jgi:CRP/FNR family transcriptional regulator